MASSVTLTILTVFLSVATLLASLVLALLFYFLRQKKLGRRLANSTSKPMIKPAALPMLSSRSLLQLKQSNFYDRLYSDSDDSGTAIVRWGAQQHIDDQLDQSVDELSDEYTERRSSSLVSSSSGDGWFVNSREESNTNGLLHTPASSTTSSPIMASQACILNLSLKYNFHQGSLIVLVINASSPPKQSSSTKGLFVVVQLFQTRQNGEAEDKEMVLKTDTKAYSTNVLFNEELKYDNLPHNALDATSIKLSLCSYDRFSRVQALGDFIVDLNEISLDPVQPIVLQRRMKQISPEPVEEKDKGELSLSLRYQRGSGRINVIVLKASNLKKPKMFMSNDPYITVKLRYKDEDISKKKTKVKKGTSNPCWNEPFVFDLEKEDLDNYLLVFAVKSRDLFSSCSKLGTVYVGAKASSTGNEHWLASVCSKTNTMRQVTMSHKLL